MKTMSALSEPGDLCSPYSPDVNVQKMKMKNMPAVDVRNRGRRPNLSIRVAIVIETMRERAVEPVWSCETLSVIVAPGWNGACDLHRTSVLSL